MSDRAAEIIAQAIFISFLMLSVSHCAVGTSERVNVYVDGEKVSYEQ